MRLFAVTAIYLPFVVGAGAQITYLVNVGKDSGVDFFHHIGGEHYIDHYIQASPVQIKETSFSSLSSQSKNHSVIQSTFDDPCTPKQDGLNSGFQAITQSPKVWSITVKETSPTWFYCSQVVPASHCQNGMVFAVNPSQEETFDTFQNKAKENPSSSAPRVSITNTVINPTNPSSSSGTGSGDGGQPTNSQTSRTTVDRSTPPVSTNLPTDSSSPPAASKSNVGVIAAVAGSVGFLLLVVVSFWIIRRRRKNLQKCDLEEEVMPHLEPFPISESARPNGSLALQSKTQGQGAVFAPQHLLFPPISDEKNIRAEQPFVLGGTPQRPPEDSQPVPENETPLNQQEITAMRAELRAVRQRLAVLEATESDEPPDYVSSYTVGLR
ncbi:hypothetical protein PM082_009639 [Marasmius tenuissimus]|nr:hypothetical protein PM082_009639 [Marasmius tenuissimus]